MIVLDASVLIAHLDRSDALHHQARALLDACAGEPWAVSALTLAEVLVGPARSALLTEALAAIEALEIDTLPVDHDAAVRLAELRASTSLKLPDCCVLLSAESNTAALATLDTRLARDAERDGVRVVEPARKP